MDAVHEVLDTEIALRPQNITSATTTTGEIFDTKGCAEFLLLIQIGTYTVNSLTALNVQWFEGEENDLGDEAQLGSNVNIFSSLATGAKILVRVKTQTGGRFGRVKVVSTGAPTALNISIAAIANSRPFMPKSASADTLAGTIQAA